SPTAQRLPERQSNPLIKENASPLLEIDAHNSVKIEAFALTVPGIPGAQWRDPQTIEPVLLPVLPNGLSEPESSSRSPVITLLLQSKGERPPFVVTTSATDARTRAFVHQSDSEQVSYEFNADNWARIAIPIGIWHDTPIDISLGFAAGEVTTQQLQFVPDLKFWRLDHPHLTARVSNGDTIHARFQRNYFQSDQGLVFHFDSLPSRAIWLWPAALPAANFLESRSSRIGLQRKGQPESWDLIPPASGAVLNRVEFVEYPKRAISIYRIAALPDMPNPRSISNLFEAQIPYIETDSPVCSVRVATQLRSDMDLFVSFPWFGRARFVTRPISNEPGLTRSNHGSVSVLVDDSVPETRTYSNLSVFELLEEHRRQQEMAGHFGVDQTKHSLVIHEHQSWKEAVKSWWRDFAPDWMQ
ncbi:MAG: hypothetical protein AAF585_13170, partial [Verrucomicrobiota bacterium]